MCVERVQRCMRDAKSMFDFGEQIKRRRLFRVGVEWSQVINLENFAVSRNARSMGLLLLGNYVSLVYWCN